MNEGWSSSVVCCPPLSSSSKKVSATRAHATCSEGHPRETHRGRRVSGSQLCKGRSDPCTSQCQGHLGRRSTVPWCSQGLLSPSIRHGVQVGRVGFYFIVPRQLVHSQPSASASPQMGQAQMTEHRNPVHQRIHIGLDGPLKRACQGVQSKRGQCPGVWHLGL